LQSNIKPAPVKPPSPEKKKEPVTVEKVKKVPDNKPFEPNPEFLVML
jgi:hypothetical protein